MLSKINDILKYLRTGRQRKLYKQWVKMASLPPEATAKDEFAGGIKPQTYKKQSGLPMLYILLLGAFLLILVAVFILLAMRSC